jgi:hypothetical protein
LKGIRRYTDKAICLLCLGAGDAIHMLLDCLKTKNWRMKCLNDKWLSVNKEVTYRKILRCTNKDQIRNLDRYLNKVKHK